MATAHRHWKRRRRGGRGPAAQARRGRPRSPPRPPGHASIFTDAAAVATPDTEHDPSGAHHRLMHRAGAGATSKPCPMEDFVHASRRHQLESPTPPSGPSLQPTTNGVLPPLNPQIPPWRRRIWRGSHPPTRRGGLRRRAPLLGPSGRACPSLPEKRGEEAPPPPSLQPPGFPGACSGGGAAREGGGECGDG
jgi:hypothetical protein